MTNPALTSESDPLRIAELPAGRGLIGITFLPGKHQNGMTGRHRRNLAIDLDMIAKWNASVVLTLVEDHELERYRVPSLGEQVRLRHMEWHHWPVPDFHAPDAAFDAEWPARSAMLRALLARGGRVLVHCKGGLGRAGTIAARLLVDDQLRDDDVVVVTRLDRLARSTKDLLDIAEKLNEAGAGLRSLAEPWADTTSPAGRMVLTVFAGIAEFERELINLRTSSGRVAAKARGVRFGRPPKLTADQVALGERLVGEGTSVREAAKLLKCHHATLYRAMTAPS
jgi:protein-tyrosine phosphatase